MNKLKLVLYSVCCVGLGVLLGYAFFKADKKILNGNKPSIDPLNSKEEINCSIELEKAKKLYGDAFSLFLANIGYRMDTKRKAELNYLISTPKNYIATRKPVESMEHSKLEIRDNFYFNEISEESKAVANKIVSDNPELFFRESKMIANDHSLINKINGEYHGKLYLIDKKHSDDVVLRINIIAEDNGTEANYFLELSRDGVPYSTKRGRGSNKNIRQHRENPNSISLEASPRGFFNFDLNNPNVLNYYYRGILKGTAVITRD